MNKQKRISIMTRLRNNNPLPITELIFNSPFELLISVLLSAKATDISVNKATIKLYSVANNAQKMLNLGSDKIKFYIKTIGLFNIKANNIIKTSKILIDKYNGKVPQNRQDLESLPGVGRKTANVILNTIFNLPTIAVDTHIFRFCNRTNFAKGKNVFEVEQKLIKVVPIEFKLHCHNWFILHSRYTCVSRKPRCNSCIIEDLCEFNNKQYIKINNI
ncbi:MAG: endonuclease III [Arsenophonus endosymbiont of Ceratovacuna japonica]